MSTLKEIQGRNIESVSSDPANAGAGDIWYNSTSNTLKGVLQNSAWSSVASMIEGRSVQNMGTGPSTAALAAGGNPGSGSNVTTTEEFNGSGWSTGGAMNSIRGGGGSCGTQSAARIAAGMPIGTTSETYNGSAWTSAPAINTGRHRLGSAAAAPSTAAIIFGGELADDTNQALTEEYNGTSWSEEGDLNTARGEGLGGAGSQTAAICFGGDSGSLSALAEEYNGTSWAAGGDLNTARKYLGSSGLQTSAVAFGGNTPPVTTATETYDGTSWTTSAAVLGTAQSEGTRAGTTGDTGLSATPGPAGAGAAEVFNVSANVITAGAWASGGAMGTGQQNPGGMGLQTAALSVGGQSSTPVYTNNTEEYDGAAWTAGGVYPASLSGIGTAGTQTAGLGFGGRSPAGVTTAAEYDGSSWTAATAYPTAISLACGVGPQTAALAATGDVYPASPRYSSLCNDYNGTSWTAATSNTGTARYDAMAAGIATAAAICGGNGSGTTEEYNGSSWSTGGVNLLNISAGGSSKNGTADDWMVFALNAVTTTGYDGTAWSTRPSLATSRYGAAGAGTGTAGLCFGGMPGFKTTTEEFTSETSATNIKTVTTS